MAGLWPSLIVIVAMVSVMVAAAGAGDTYSPDEIRILPKFLDKMKGNLTQDYMFENKYLVRFLRARGLNIEAAEELLLQSLAWRKRNKVESILSEDFSIWERAHPFYFPNDRTGRPSMSSGLGGFNFRKYVLAGRADEVRRYIYYSLERGFRNMQRVSNETGTEWIEGHLLFNLAGFSTRTHACLQCLPHWIELAESYENYYPNWARKIIGINCPRIFQIVLQAIRPFLTPHTQESIFLYGYDKEEWKREVLKIFPPENITPEFGGTRKLRRA